MKLRALKDFKGAEDRINAVQYVKGQIFETDNKEYYDDLIRGKLCVDASDNRETKVVEVEETKNKKKAKKDEEEGK